MLVSELRSKRNGFLLSLLAGTIYLFIYHGAVLCSPNSYQFHHEGDAIKAYYTLAYHVVHDSTWWHFDGMNHPYGDHLHYPDAQPILANGLKVLGGMFPSVKSQTVGWVNMYVLAGILLGLPFLFLLFSEFGARWEVALCIAFAAWVLNPQLIRMNGHFGLAHCWVIPAILWSFLIGARNHARMRYPFILVIAVTVSIWTHPYLAIIGIAPIWLYGISRSLIRWKRPERPTLRLLALSILPLFAFLLIDSLGPSHEGRSEYPLGFFDNRTTVFNILSPLKEERSPLHRFLFSEPTDITIEGLCYLGGAVVLLPIALFYLLRQPMRKYVAYRADVLILYFVCTLLLLYAMGIPFIWDLKRFVWKLPLLDEFRSSGRFSWPFYYVSFGVVALAFTEWVDRSRYRKLAWAGIVLLMTVQTYEAHFTKRSVRRNLVRSNMFIPDAPPDELKHLIVDLNNHENLRSFIPLPFFHYGSEGVLAGHERDQHKAMMVSFHTGLPMMASAIAKTSITEARAIVSMFNPPFYDQPLLQKINANDSIAVIAFRDELPIHDAALIQSIGPVVGYGDCRIAYARSHELFNRSEHPSAEQLRDLIHQSEKMQFNGDTALFFNFDHLDSEISLRGTGSYYTAYGEYETVVELNPHPFTKGRDYILSLWLDSSRPLADYSMYIISMESEPAVGEHWDRISDGRRALVRHEGRSFLEIPFTCTHDGIFRFYINHSPYYPSRALLDDLLIREKGDTVTFTDNDDLFWNGLIIPSD